MVDLRHLVFPVTRLPNVFCHGLLGYFFSVESRTSSGASSPFVEKAKNLGGVNKKMT